MSRRLAALLLILSASCAAAPPDGAAEPSPAAAVPAAGGGAAESPAQQAARLKEQGKALRDEAETAYRRAEAACHDKFLVNSCIDRAKAERLETIRRARELEAEGRRIDLAERRRAAEETGHDDATDAPRAPAIPSPAGAATVRPAPEAERLRAERAAELEKAEAAARAERADKDAARAAQRARAEADAAKRARQAEADRERYDKRIREYETEQARDADGKR